MGIEYNELNPADSVFTLKGREFEIRSFDLLAQSWAHSFFATADEPNGMSVLARRVSNIEDVEAIAQIAFHLLKDKEFFNKNFKEFMTAIESEDRKWIKVVEIYKAVVKTLGVSQPKIEEIREEIELKKSQAAVM